MKDDHNATTMNPETDDKKGKDDMKGKDDKKKTEGGSENKTDSDNASTQVVYSAAVIIIPVITATWNKKPSFLLN